MPPLLAPLTTRPSGSVAGAPAIRRGQSLAARMLKRGRAMTERPHLPTRGRR
jgi:hypothetical protein